MDRAEKIGLGIAIAGHVVVFGLLSVGFLSAPNPAKLEHQPVEVSLVKDVGLEAAAPQAVTPPAQSVAPDKGAPEDAAPPAPQEDAPAPKPEPAPPLPQPKPAPPEPVRQPKPAPAAKPVPVPAKPKPQPAAPEKTASKPAPAKQTAATAPAKAKPAATKGAGTKETATTARPRGSRLGANFLEGLTDKPSTSTSTAPRAAKIDAHAMAGIVQAIARQIQPCADRQVNPGPGANEISIKLNLRLNQDGTLAATPAMVGAPTGVTDENERYVQRVRELGVAAFKGCSPLKLPAEYYSTPSGGGTISTINGNCGDCAASSSPPSRNSPDDGRS